MRYRIILIFMIASGTSVKAQLGGQYAYDFLNIPVHARLAALGGVNVSHYNKDQNFFFTNPALVSDSLAGWASASYLFYVADIGQASFAYTFTTKRAGAFSIGVQHLNYGELEGFDATGLSTGTFRSGETAVIVSRSHQISTFRLGVNSKWVFSNLAGFRSAAWLFDLGGVFVHPSQDLTVGLVIKNFGFRLSDYSDTNKSTLPFDIQVGATFKPEHMPLRFSFTAHNLVRLGKSYDNPDDDDIPSTASKVLSHFNFGAEVLLHRNFHILAGYNFLRQQELRVESGGGGGGFSFGLAMNIRSVNLVVSQSRYSIGQANYTFTLAANIEQMIFKKRVL